MDICNQRNGRAKSIIIIEGFSGEAAQHELGGFFMYLVHWIRLSELCHLYGHCGCMNDIYESGF